MHDGNSNLVARTPFEGLTAERPASSAVHISERDGLEIASVVVRKGRHTALAERLRACFDIELPRGPIRATAGYLALVGVGPDAWLATCERGGNAFASSLRETIAGVASVSDQSDGYAVLRLSGSRVREILGKLVPIDVHARAFKVNDVATTAAEHIGVTMWRLEDSASGSPVFDIALHRSFAHDFWQALADCAAEFGTGLPPQVSYPASA